MKTAMPTFEQVRELPELLRLTVPVGWEDINGHVNVQHYTAMYDLAGDPIMEMLGIDKQFVEVQRVGFFDLEHHVWYLDEILVGQDVAVHARMVECGDKRMLGLIFIVNLTAQRLASVIEYVATAASLDTRRTVPLPDAVARRTREIVAAHGLLAWSPPRCGSISI
jgi:acyl-CoA thioester hydrolase